MYVICVCVCVSVHEKVTIPEFEYITHTRTNIGLFFLFFYFDDELRKKREKSFFKNTIPFPSLTGFSQFSLLLNWNLTTQLKKNLLSASMFGQAKKNIVDDDDDDDNDHYTLIIDLGCLFRKILLFTIIQL